MVVNQQAQFLEFRQRLNAAGIHHRVIDIRDESLAIEVVVPGQHWEVEFMENGGVEVERFISNGEISDVSVLEDLFRDFAD